MTNDPQITDLRRRVLDELVVVDGHIALSERLTGVDAKEQLRLAHQTQRKAALVDAAEFLITKEHHLLKEFANGDEVEPRAIDPIIIPVRTPNEADLFRLASLQWSVPVSSGYGRRSRFLVRDQQNGKLIAIFALGDPVIAQSARDNVIGWSTDQRNRRLYNVYDAFVLGAVEPYRQLLAGKLVALLTLSNETREFLVRKYEGSETQIRKVVKDPTPALITTTSALGRSSIYNRLTYEGRRMFYSVGYTKGYGHFQFSNELFAELREFVRVSAEADPALATRVQSSTYGSGPNWRFRVIRNALQLLNIPDNTLQHNIRREVFIAPVAANWDSYLRGEVDELELLDLPATRIAAYYRERWAMSRADRYPGFRLWRREEASLVNELDVRTRQMSFEESSYPNPGEVSMRPYLLRVGVEETETRGETIGGKIQPGSAYLSQLVGPDVGLTLADIQWANGEREVRGWSRHESSELYEQVVDRLRIGVYRSERFSQMAVMDIRVPSPSENGVRRATVRRTNVTTLSGTLGIDVVQALDKLGEAIVGTRAELLRDEGTRRNDLCVAFPADSLVVPAVVWSLVRPIALGLANDAAMPRPGVPIQRISAPPRRSRP